MTTTEMPTSAAPGWLHFDWCPSFRCISLFLYVGLRIATRLRLCADSSRRTERLVGLLVAAVLVAIATCASLSNEQTSAHTPRSRSSSAAMATPFYRFVQCFGPEDSLAPRHRTSQATPPNSSSSNTNANRAAYITTARTRSSSCLDAVKRAKTATPSRCTAHTAQHTLNASAVATTQRTTLAPLIHHHTNTAQPLQQPYTPESTSSRIDAAC